MKPTSCLILTTILFAGFLTSCGTPTGKAKFPQASESFSPRQIYVIAQESLWNAVLSTLEKNRVAILSQDKASGIIQTDYLEGQGQTFGGFLVSQSTRYKYNITVRKQSDQEAKLAILSKVESSLANGQGSTQWTDAGAQNSRLLKNLENWLYEQVEKELPQGALGK